MTTREKIAHLYRRLGFGATPAELDAGVKAGIRATTNDLIDFEKVPQSEEMSPFEFVWRDKGEPDLGAYRFRHWWVCTMVCTKRPLQERLAMFWHNHFPASDGKVEDGAMMLDYLQVLRTHAAGKFVDILTAVSKNPAMMRYLDMQRSIRGNPNENFAREVMELFTLGIGNYTEQDVKEAARALTGWGYVHVYYDLPGNAEQKVKDWVTYGRPFSSFTLMPVMHDPTPKTILGKSGDINGDELLVILSRHPATARFLSKKLWEHFAYADPEPAVIEKIAKVFSRSDGDIKTVLRAIVNSPEFWSKKCVRQRVKSPVDLFIPIARQLGAGERLLALRGPGATPFTRIPNQVFDSMYSVVDRIDKCGLNLLWPPDVSGWRWGRAWITPSMMLERYKFNGVFVYGPKGPDVATKNTQAFIKSRSPKSEKDIAAALAEFFDVQLPDSSLELVATMIKKHGGLKGLQNDNQWADALHHAISLIMAAPEMHFC